MRTLKLLRGTWYLFIGCVVWVVARPFYVAGYLWEFAVVMFRDGQDQLSADFDYIVDELDAGIAEFERAARKSPPNVIKLRK